MFFFSVAQWLYLVWGTGVFTKATVLLPSFPSLPPFRSVNSSLCCFWESGAGLKCWFTVCLYGSLAHSDTEVSLSCGLSSLLTSLGFWWYWGSSFLFFPSVLPLKSLVMTTLLYTTEMNLLSVREPVSTKLNYWGQKHFTFFFQTEMSIQCIFQFSWTGA